MTLGWEVAGWGSGHCGLRCRHIHPGGRGARQRGSGSCHLAHCPSSPTHRGNGAASKPEVPAPESESQLLVLSPPLSRSPVFSRPCGLSSPSAATGSLPLCPTSLCLYPNPSTPASQQQPLPTVMSRCLGSPMKPLHRWLRSFPTAASVQITAAQGHLPAACVLPVLPPHPKPPPTAILCCLFTNHYGRGLLSLSA